LDFYVIVVPIEKARHVPGFLFLTELIVAAVSRVSGVVESLTNLRRQTCGFADRLVEGAVTAVYTDGTEQEQAKAKYRGLSTARRTLRLSAASVEMTFLWFVFG
jgi:hypothetical protein